MGKEAEWVAAQLKGLARTERARLGVSLPRPHVVSAGAERIPEGEQVRRFVAGEERWRVEAGLVTPADFAAYERAMVERLRAGR